MNPSREESLFAAALEKPAAERPSFLDSPCHGDPALRQRLEDLLAAHEGNRSPSPGLTRPSSGGILTTIPFPQSKLARW